MNDFWKQLDAVLTQKLFQIGEHPVTVSGVFVFLLLVLATLVFAHLAERLLVRRLFKHYGLRKGLDMAIGRLVKYAVIAVGVLISFQTIGVQMDSVAVIFGFLSVGIGFGLQNLTSNFISGILLLVERPVKVGDRIYVDGVAGDITDIRIRATVVRTLDNVCIIVPNSKLIEEKVTNWSYDNDILRVHVDVGVAYGSDVERVRQILLTVAQDHKEVLGEPEPKVFFMEFGDSSLNFTLFAYIHDLRNAFGVRSDLRFAIDKAFRENGIEIPFPQRDIHMKSMPAPPPGEPA
jgi:small-conductance mechanosensitive channel